MQEALFDYRPDSDDQARERWDIDGYSGHVPLPFTEEAPEIRKQDSAESALSVDSQWQIEWVRQEQWYFDRLREIDFNLEEITADKEFADLLTAYGLHLHQAKPTPFYQLDKHILRTELREIVREENKNLARQIIERYPDPSSYNDIVDLLRHCHDFKSWGARINIDPSICEKKKAIYLVYTIGCLALFHKPPLETKVAVFKDSRELSKKFVEEQVKPLHVDDLLPGQFLLARIWCAKRLCSLLEDYPDKSLTESLEYFAYLNDTARCELRHTVRQCEVVKNGRASIEGKSLSDARYIEILCGMKPIKEDSEPFLLQHARKKFRRHVALTEFEKL